jgi:ribosomal protein L11 methylase PrmA
MSGITQKKGAVVVSGIKLEEVDDLLDIYGQHGLQCTWRASEKEWAGLVLKKDKHEYYHIYT